MLNRLTVKGTLAALWCAHSAHNATSDSRLSVDNEWSLFILTSPQHIGIPTEQASLAAQASLHVDSSSCIRCCGY